MKIAVCDDDKRDIARIKKLVKALSLYMYGGMYAIFSGDEVDNIHVDYVNAASGEIISSADSKDMGE